MVHLIGNNISTGKPVKALHMLTLLNLFPDVEFEASKNEEDDVNELADDSYSQVIKKVKYNYVGLFLFLILSKTIAFPRRIFSISFVIWKQFLMLADKISNFSHL